MPDFDTAIVGTTCLNHENHACDAPKRNEKPPESDRPDGFSQMLLGLENIYRKNGITPYMRPSSG